jgi:hypothetical protein
MRDERWKRGEGRGEERKERRGRRGEGGEERCEVVKL